MEFFLCGEPPEVGSLMVRKMCQKRHLDIMNSYECFRKIVGFPPKSSILNKEFSTINFEFIRLYTSMPKVPS